MTSLELLEQQLRECREESDAVAEKHRIHIDCQNAATIKEGPDLLRKLRLAQREERRDVKQVTLQDTPLTSRMPPLGGTMQRAASENYRDIVRKRKANSSGYDAAAIAVGSTAAFHAPTGTPLAHRMAQQDQQMMMYQQAMQQQNMANSQWMGMHSASPYTTPSQNAWAHFSTGSQSNFNMQCAAQSQQQNQLYGMNRNDTAALHGYPLVPQSGGSATPVAIKSSTRHDQDPRSTKRIDTTGSSMLQHHAKNAFPQHYSTTANAPTSGVDDVLSNEDAAAILALVEMESERSTSSAIGVTATPSTSVASQNFTYIASLNAGPSHVTRHPGLAAYSETMTAKPHATGSGQRDKSTTAAHWSYY